MLPPESSAQTGAAAGDLPREQRGDADGARALDDELAALEEQRDRLRDLVVGHVHEVVEQRRRGSPSSAPPGCLTAIPSAIV